MKNVQAQLSNAEWLLSAPGADQIKSFLPDCVGCHTLQRVYSQIHTPDEWKQVFTRMGRYAPESVPTRPQLLLQGGPRSERPRVPAALMDKASEYLTNANVRNHRGDRRLQLHAGCRARRAARPTSSSPNTTCRGRKRCRMT